MAELVCDDVSAGEICAGRAQLGFHLLPEGEVEIDGLVGRAIKRPHRGLAIAAARARALRVDDGIRLLVAVEQLGPDIVDVRPDHIDELAGLILWGADFAGLLLLAG